MPANPTKEFDHQTVPWSPLDMVERILIPQVFRYFKGNDKLAVVVLAFDSADVPEKRRVFYEQKRYKKSDDAKPREGFVRHPDGRDYRPDDYPVDDALVSRITPASLPASWSAIFNNPKAKQRLFRVIASIFQHKVIQGYGVPAGPLYCVDTGERRWFSRRSDHFMGMPALSYGEGDQKSIWWSARLAARGLSTRLVTIDWDMPLCLLLWDSGIKVKISRAYVSKAQKEASVQYDSEGVFFTKAKALKHLGINYQQASEVVDITLAQRAFGGAADKRGMHQLVFIILLGTCCDYNNSVRSFLTPKFTAALLDSFSELAEPFLELGSVCAAGDPVCRRTLTFLPAAFLQFIQAVSTSTTLTIRNDDLKGFTDEIHDILWVLRYFSGWDAARTPSGPELPDYAHPIFKGSGLRQVLGSKSAMQPYTLTEAYPLPLELLPFPPEVLFSAEHAKQAMMTSASPTD